VRLGVPAEERGWFADPAGRLVRRCGWLLVPGVVAILTLVGYCMSTGSLDTTVGWLTLAFVRLDGSTVVVLAVRSSAGSRVDGTHRSGRSPPQRHERSSPCTSCTSSS